MSEEQAQIESRVIIDTGVHRAAIVVVEFADGQHAIPAFVVAHAGGRDAILAQAEELRDLTFEKFMKGFSASAVSEHLQSIQRRIISEHMRSLYR